MSTPAPPPTPERPPGWPAPGERVYTASEVGVIFRVDPKTVTRWAAAGRIAFFRTPGGHRRYRESEVRRLLTEGTGT